MTCLIFVILVCYLFWFHTKKACDIREVHWASNGSYCITQDCYMINSCGKWAKPSHRCQHLKVGMKISEVYFELGQPMEINGNVYKRHDKTGSNLIEAEIRNESLHTINCQGK